MKRFLLWLLVVVMFCAVTAGGCGGGSDGDVSGDDSGQTENFNEEGRGDTEQQQGEEEGRGGSGSGSVSVHIDTASAWIARDMAFYGRKSNGEWERLKHWNRIETYDTTGNKDFTVSKEYVAFGFEVDVYGGTRWPYSGVFWDEGAPDKIEIDLAGTSYNVSVKISVDGLQEYYDSNASEHTQYGWNSINVEFSHSGFMYNYKSAAFYGRKTANGAWVKLIDFSKGRIETTNHADVTQKTERRSNNNGTYTSKLPEYLVPRDYVEFGFEFDIADGTNWPYSDVFWKAADTQKEAPNKIYVYIGGAIRTASIEIKVNDRTVFNESNCPAHSPHYWKTEDKIRVKTWKTGAYSNKFTRFYARKNSNSKWTKLLDVTDGDQEIFIDNDYVEFGFEFDIYNGTDWPYSDVFWTAANSAREVVEDIYIEMGGAIRTATLDIYVNGKNRFHDGNCSSHSQHYWKMTDNISLTIDDDGDYSTKSKAFYARKENGGWECLYSAGNGDVWGMSISSDYVEFGFEFDIRSGTDWPYSNVFWTASQSKSTPVENIWIRLGGGARTATIEIKVNNSRVFYDSNCDSHSRRSW